MQERRACPSGQIISIAVLYHLRDANIYFKLASQFRTQDEPAYCGLSTLVMVLNALEVDPGRVWKAPWRFYHESMLDCCVPLENVKKLFACLATCNRLLCEVRFGEEGEDFLSALRRDIRVAVSGDKEVIVASYDRSQLQQTGTGHFSPLAAFHAASDRVLIMDVARFKYPPHWVQLDHLQKAMCSIDVSTKRTRGTCIWRVSIVMQLLEYSGRRNACLRPLHF
ncbi:unnamed protein product [Angiostrongylus costaricensis]|uniref:glutathione gamma-glutamylcysteinyltransferase n=1 Tax=Angiostrongylus costaricensis TaxID=334426 RepID=A0A3P7K5N0_ANGCS|nr:unnamed protein product [Angiostrongylus costaricensis]